MEVKDLAELVDLLVGPTAITLVPGDPAAAAKTLSDFGRTSRKLELRGAYGYEHDFPAALQFASELRPSRLIDRGWPLSGFKKALEQAPKAARNGNCKTVFEI